MEAMIPFVESSQEGCAIKHGPDSIINFFEAEFLTLQRVADEDQFLLRVLAKNAAQLGAGADFAPPSGTLTFTFSAWAEAAQGR